MKKPTKEPEPIPPLPENWDRCQVYIRRKRRYCRQTICPTVPESLTGKIAPIYCGNHSDLYLSICPPADDNGNDSKRPRLNDAPLDDKGSKWKRIKCPIDPTHTIYEHKLQKHLKICPKAKQIAKERSQVYYRENINKGGMGSIQDPINGTEEATYEEPTTEFGVLLAKRILNAYCDLFLHGTNYTSQSSNELYNAIPLKDHYASESKRGLEEDLDKCRIKIGGTKHMQQIGSMVGHTRASNLLNASTQTVLEMGAGRGTTGFVVASTLSKETGKDVNLVMVEKSGSRSNADTIIRRGEKEKLAGKDSKDATRRYLNERGLKVDRIKCDLAHVYLPSVCSLAKDEDNSKPDILVVAKHLCGAGMWPNTKRSLCQLTLCSPHVDSHTHVYRNRFGPQISSKYIESNTRMCFGYLLSWYMFLGRICRQRLFKEYFEGGRCN